MLEQITESFTLKEGDVMSQHFHLELHCILSHLCRNDTICCSTERQAGFTFDQPDLILPNVFPRPVGTRPAAHLSPAPVHHV